MKAMTRRSFSALSVAAATGACASAAAPTHPPIGLQMYMLGPEPSQDFAGACAALAAIGYGEVELPGLYGQTPSALRHALDASGLRCPSLHVPLRAFTGVSLSFDDGVTAVADAAHAIGANYVVAPMVPWPNVPHFAQGDDVIAILVASTRAMSPDDWARAGDRFNTLAEALARENLQFAYHNHNLEFLSLGGAPAIEALIAHTDPALVRLEVDVGWVAAAGVDPASFIDRHGARVKLLHLKDTHAVAPNTALHMNACDVGAGVVDFHAILAAARRARVAHYFVEQEPPFVRPPLDSARAAYGYLRPLV